MLLARRQNKEGGYLKREEGQSRWNVEKRALACVEPDLSSLAMFQTVQVGSSSSPATASPMHVLHVCKIDFQGYFRTFDVMHAHIGPSLREEMSFATWFSRVNYLRLILEPDRPT